MKVVLREYQLAAIDKIRREYAAGRRRVVLVAPTGSGKTVCFSFMVRAAVERGRRCIVVVHRRELANQTLDKLASFGVEAGVIMGSDSRRASYAAVQVCSIQTLARRLGNLPPADFIILDEAHLSTSQSYRAVLAAYPNAFILGATATPWRTDRVGLKDMYDSHVVAATPSELIASGALVRYTAFGYDSPDLHKVRVTGGDYNAKDLGLAANTDILVGGIVDEYRAHGENRRALVFAVNIEHSERLVAQFNAAGFAAAHVDCETPNEKRKQILAAYARGDIRVLSSVAIFTTGWDCPPAEICILARPTKSLSLLLQMVGRVLRPSPDTGKRSAMIHDHGGNLMRLGPPDEDRDYALTATPKRVKDLHTCPECRAFYSTLREGRWCPECSALVDTPSCRVCLLEMPPSAPTAGTLYCACDPTERVANEKILVDGKRIDIDAIRALRAERGIDRPLTDVQLLKVAIATRADKVGEYLRLCAVAEAKGFKPGFVAHAYRGTFSVWPKFTDVEIRSGTPATRPFIPLGPRKVAT